MQTSMNDNSINTRFCWQTRIRSQRDFHTFCYTDGLFKKKYACQFVFPRKKIFSRDFRFSFLRESSFPRRIPGSDTCVQEIERQTDREKEFGDVSSCAVLSTLHCILTCSIASYLVVLRTAVLLQYLTRGVCLVGTF